MLAVVVALLVGVWLALRVGPSPRSGPSEVGPAAASNETEVAARAISGSPSALPTRVRSPSPEQLAARSRMRDRIVDALQARERAAPRDRANAPSASAGTSGPGDGPDVGESTDDSTDSGPPPRREARGSGGLVDRTGDHESMVEVMTDDLLPLADECIGMARETDPQLLGMLVLNFEIIAEEEIGGVIESVSPGEGNEVSNPELLECLRESILATTLPAPEHGGRDAVSISLRLAPEGDAE